MSESTFVWCGRCFRRYKRQVVVACVCGSLIATPVAYAIAHDGEVKSLPAPVALSTATSGGAVTTQFTHFVTHQVYEGLGSGFHSMQAAVPAEQRKNINYKRVYLMRSQDDFMAVGTVDEVAFTDVSSGSVLKSAKPQST